MKTLKLMLLMILMFFSSTLSASPVEDIGDHVFSKETAVQVQMNILETSTDLMKISLDQVQKNLIKEDSETDIENERFLYYQIEKIHPQLLIKSNKNKHKEIKNQLSKSKKVKVNQMAKAKKTTFISNDKNVRAMIKEGVYVQFVDGVYSTEDEAEIASLKKRFETSEVLEKASVEAEKQVLNELESEKAKVENLTKAHDQATKEVTALTEKVAELEAIIAEQIEEIQNLAKENEALKK